MRRVGLQTWAAVLGLSVLWIALGTQIVGGARKHDFLNLYSGASLALEGNFAHMHSPDVQLARERRYVQNLDALVPFVRLQFYALILAPLALIPFGPAFWVWLALQSAILIGCWVWAFRRWGEDALVFGALYLPTALGIAHGQDCVVMLVIVIAVYSLADRKRDFAGGVALGLGLIKFHLFLLWPLALLIQKRWRMAAGACVSVGVALLVSLLLAGPGGIAEYFALLRKKDIEHLNPSPELGVSVHALAINFGWDNLVARALLIALVVVLVSLACWRAPLWRCLAAVSVGSLLTAPHIYGYDAALLLAGLWISIFVCTQKWTRIAATLATTPIPFLMTLAGSPWAAATPLVFLFFLANLARLGWARNGATTLL